MNTAMPLALDAELLQTMMAAMAGPDFVRPEPAARDDWKAVRTNSDAALVRLAAAMPAHPEVTRTDHEVSSFDGATVLARWYVPADRRDEPGPAAVYLHGGGMIAGSVDLHDRTVAGYVADSGVPMLAVDYRLAPEHPHPIPVEDAYAGLGWLVAQAEKLPVDPARIALVGDSAGGGLAAAAALLARDRGLAVAKQILIYPMLDDRNTQPDPHLAEVAFWSYDDNYTGWHALLGDAVGGAGVPEYAAPARAEDLTGLPATYIEVGNWTSSVPSPSATPGGSPTPVPVSNCTCTRAVRTVSTTSARTPTSCAVRGPIDCALWRPCDVCAGRTR